MLVTVSVYGVVCRPGRERALAWRLLEAAVEREHGISPLPRVERLPGGKPWFPDYPHIHFNVSHSAGGAVCALSDAPVGVDVELRRQPPSRLSAGLEPEAFWRLWTGKEATVKRDGRGLPALMRLERPDVLCLCREEFLPGYTVAVCPSAQCPVQWRLAAIPPERNG